MNFPKPPAPPAWIEQAACFLERLAIEDEAKHKASGRMGRPLTAAQWLLQKELCWLGAETLRQSTLAGLAGEVEAGKAAALRAAAQVLRQESEALDREATQGARAVKPNIHARRSWLVACALECAAVRLHLEAEIARWNEKPGG